MTSWLLLGVGLAVLVTGAELLVRGASRMAAKLGISPLLIGLTIVAFGTSSPEIAVSLGAVANGQPDLALGNAFGSNTFNILFILGLSAIVCALVVQQKLIRIGVPLIIVAGAVLWIMLLDSKLGRLDGALLLLGLVTYIVSVICAARREAPKSDHDSPQAVDRKPQGVVLAVLMVLVGLGLSVLGARWLVQGCVSIAASFGVSELVIGLTIVAAGTSLPEVATSLVAAVRGQRDIAVGNVLGSNIFNILGILGLAGMVAPAGITAPPSLVNFDLVIMLAASFLCLPIMLTGFRVDRWEGGLFLAAYIGYLIFTVLNATGSDPISNTSISPL
ncbi:MAG: calcium/sodium antiporter [Planctomycetota bacterium]